MHVRVDVHVVLSARGAGVECEIVQALCVVLSLLQSLLFGGKAVIWVRRLKAEDTGGVLHAVVGAEVFAGWQDIKGRFGGRFDRK